MLVMDVRGRRPDFLSRSTDFEGLRVANPKQDTIAGLGGGARLVWQLLFVFALGALLLALDAQVPLGEGPVGRSRSGPHAHSTVSECSSCIFGGLGVLQVHVHDAFSYFSACSPCALLDVRVVLIYFLKSRNTPQPFFKSRSVHLGYLLPFSQELKNNSNLSSQNVWSYL